MPTIARRTPTTEEASAYGYRDLLKDIIGKISTGATSNVERMTSGGMSEEEILETALAPAGGMLKIAGTSKLLAGLVKNMSKFRKELVGVPTKELTALRKMAIRDAQKWRFEKPQAIFKEALKVPEKEYRRIRDIGWSSMRGEKPGTKGLYFPMEKDIALHPTRADIKTIWHEFTHARQWSPEKISTMPGKDVLSEITYAKRLMSLTDELKDVSGKLGISWGEFYKQYSPIERHARGVSRVAVKDPRKFGKFYKELLEKEVRDSETRVADFVRSLEKQDALGMRFTY